MTMRRRVWFGLAAGLLAGTCWLAPGGAADRPPASASRPAAAATDGPQDQPVQKPRFDYMSTFLSRSTSPLGLRNDPASEKLLRQPATKWAVRAGVRHILW